MSRPNREYPASQYPEFADECWELGKGWYREWYHLQQDIETTSREYGRLRPRAEDARRRIDREVLRSQQQRALSRQYGDLLDQYDRVRRTLDRNDWLRRSMKGLGEHMRRRALIYEDDLPTFPLDM